MSQVSDPAAPISDDMFDAYPVGGLGLLTSIASMLAALHGVDVTRRLFVKLAAADDVWRQLQGSLEPAPSTPAPDTAIPPEGVASQTKRSGLGTRKRQPD